MADARPFDISRFKDTVKASILKHRISTQDDHSEDFFTMALALSAAVKKVLFEKSETKFSSEPVIEKKPIVQFMRRMRVDGMEKFQATAFFSFVHFYRNAAALETEQPLGILIVYIERTFVPEMLRLLKYPYIDYDDDAQVLDGMGAIANLIAGQFKRELARLGYADLEMSHFQSHVNSVVNGVDYPHDQNEKYEISFEVDGKKRMAVEMVVDPLPKIMVEEL